MAMNYMCDSRGVLRGGCSSCSCDGYDGGSELRKCLNCGHPPGKHQNMSTGTVSSVTSSISAASAPTSPDSMASNHATVFVPPPVCAIRGCTEEASFDLNTGNQNMYCDKHLLTAINLSTDGLATNSWTLISDSSDDLAAASSESSEAEDSDEDDQDSSSDHIRSNGGKPGTTAAAGSSLPTSKGWNLFSNMFSSLMIGPWSRASKDSKLEKSHSSASNVAPSHAPAPVTSVAPPPVPNPTTSLRLSSEIDHITSVKSIYNLSLLYYTLASVYWFLFSL